MAGWHLPYAGERRRRCRAWRDRGCGEGKMRVRYHHRVEG